MHAFAVEAFSHQPVLIEVRLATSYGVTRGQSEDGSYKRSIRANLIFVSFFVSAREQELQTKAAIPPQRDIEVEEIELGRV